MAVDLVIVNARIRTGDPQRPWADAVAIEGERLKAVGSSAGIRKLTGTARVIDARRAMLVPAVVNTHHQAADGDLLLGPAESDVLRAGAHADLVMIDGDLTGALPATIRAAQLLLAVVRGRIVRER